MGLLLAACAPDQGPRVDLCRRALEALEGGQGLRLAEPLAPESPDGRTVVLRYRLEGPGLPAGEQRIACRFAPDARGFGPPELVGVQTDRGGELSLAALYFLRRFGLERPPLLAQPSPEPRSAYFLQQLANAAVPAAVYALLATGYALIYGLTGRINLAFGDFTTVGAIAAANGLVLGILGGLALLPAAAPLGLVLAVATGAALGRVLHALVFAPLRRRSSQALLIATLGLGIALTEALRLATRSRQIWLPPFLGQPVAPGFVPVALSAGQAVLVAVAALAVGAVLLLLRRSAFGRCYRACADDPGAAALVGVDVARTLRRALVLGGALAGVAGFVVAARYGLVAFGMGTLWGFKALAAAIVGGIGSVPGAALGGALIGLAEGLWAAYLPGAYREAALFALLALVLLWRPHGLFGAPAPAENPALWRPGRG